MHELIWPAVNFSVLVGVLVYFCRKPVRDFVNTRHQTVRAQLTEAETKIKEAKLKFEQFDRKLSGFESEAQEILKRAQADGEAVKAKIIAAAEQMSKRIIADAEKNALSREAEIKNEIRMELIREALSLAESKISSNISSDDQKRIVNDYVGRV